MNPVKSRNRLCELRGSQSLDEVAKAVGISSTALVQYENGGRVPRDEIKQRLAEYYQCSIRYIFSK